MIAVVVSGNDSAWSGALKNELGSAIEDALARVMPGAALLKLSAATGEGVERWLGWLERRRHDVLHRRTAAARADVE